LGLPSIGVLVYDIDLELLDGFLTLKDGGTG
jgi:hypothetical protein